MDTPLDLHDHDHDFHVHVLAHPLILDFCEREIV
jgi:hypothetical protein